MVKGTGQKISGFAHFARMNNDFESVRKKLVHIEHAGSEGTDEPVNQCSLAIALAYYTHKVWL